MKLLKTICLAALSLFSLGLSAQTGEGIRMTAGSWQEIVSIARSEKKPIFVDVYTKWCGPCLNMSKTVFTNPAVGMFYNEHFVCTKIDAEDGEGMEFAKKYDVHLYPTYLFIDPETGELLHRSSSVQSAANFIKTGNAALDPELSIFRLEKEYAGGNESPEFLRHYIEYQAIAYRREEVAAAFEKLVKQGDGLKDPANWKIFSESLSGYTPYVKEVSDHYDEYVAAIGKEAVDKKLTDATAYIAPDELAGLCDFEGKEQNLRMSTVERTVRDKKYDEAAAMIDEDLAGKYAGNEKYMFRLLYIVRQMKYYPDTFPDSWVDKCVEYARYIAYNWPDRDNVDVHFLYASILELVIQRNPAPSQTEKIIISAPKSGKDVYDMRDPNLAKKPVRK